MLTVLILATGDGEDTELFKSLSGRGKRRMSSTRALFVRLSEHQRKILRFACPHRCEFFLMRVNRRAVIRLL